MEVVRAGPRRYVDDTAGSAPILRSEVARCNAELLHGVKWNDDSNTITEDRDVLDAVQKNFRSGRALSIQVVPDTTCVGVLRFASRRHIAGGDISRELHKVIRVARQAR